MSKAHALKFDKFERDLQLATAPKRGGVHHSRLAGHEVYSVKAKKTGGNNEKVFCVLASAMDLGGGRRCIYITRFELGQKRAKKGRRSPIQFIRQLR